MFSVWSPCHSEQQRSFSLWFKYTRLRLHTDYKKCAPHAKELYAKERPHAKELYAKERPHSKELLRECRIWINATAKPLCTAGDRRRLTAGWVGLHTSCESKMTGCTCHERTQKWHYAKQSIITRKKNLYVYLYWWLREFISPYKDSILWQRVFIPEWVY